MAKVDYSLDRELLYEALSSSMMERFEKTVSESDIDSNYPESFRRKMRMLIGVDIKNPDKKTHDVKKIIVIGLIAAAILTGCAVIGKVIGPYVEKYFEEYIFVKNEEIDDGTKIIEKVYTLSYVPDGYAFEKELSTPNMRTYIWRNSSNKVLKYIQTTNVSDFYTDIASSYSFLMEYNGTEIYCKKGAYDISYIWHDSRYGFELITQEMLGESDIRQILDGIMLKGQ